MANKPIKTIIKLQLEAGKANPAPPVGTALGPQGINIQDFCKQFNDATKDMGTDIVPAEITIYEDRSFDFKLKTPPVWRCLWSRPSPGQSGTARRSLCLF